MLFDFTVEILGWCIGKTLEVLILFSITWNLFLYELLWMTTMILMNWIWCGSSHFCPIIIRYLFLYLSFVLFHWNWQLEIHQRDLAGHHLTRHVHYASHQWQWLKNLKRWPRWLSARNVIYKWLSRIYSSAKSCRGFWLIWRVGRLSIKLKW